MLDKLENMVAREDSRVHDGVYDGNDFNPGDSREAGRRMARRAADLLSVCRRRAAGIGPSRGEGGGGREPWRSVAKLAKSRERESNAADAAERALDAADNAGDVGRLR